MKIRLFLFFLVPLLLRIPSSFGLGVQVLDENAAATARGNAFSATADNPSAVYYNPAGITQLNGTNILGGFYGLAFDINVHLQRQDRSLDTKYNPQGGPQFFATWKPKTDFPITFGLGIYTPFGYSLKYDDNVAFRKLGVENAIQFLTFNPVAAWQINKTLSVAVGPTINYASAEFQRGLFKPGDEFRVSGSDVAGGAIAGILWQPTPMNSFGLTYHSSVEMDFKGHANLKYDSVVVPIEIAPGIVMPHTVVKGVDSTQPAKAEFHFPQYVTGGYSFRPTPDWNLEADVVWTDWDSLNSVIVHQKSGDIAIPLNWKSSFTYEFGATRNFGTYHVSAGYMYVGNSVPDQSFGPLTPDGVHDAFSVGVGRKLQHWSWDIAYQFVYGPSRTVSQDSAADGRYKFESNAVTFSLGYAF